MNNNKYQKYNKIIGGASSQPDIELIKKLEEENKFLKDELHEARERLHDLDVDGLMVPTTADVLAARLEKERKKNKDLKQKNRILGEKLERLESIIIINQPQQELKQQLEKKILQNKQLIELDTVNASNYNKLKENYLYLESDYEILRGLYNYEIKNRNN